MPAAASGTASTTDRSALPLPGGSARAVARRAPGRMATGAALRMTRGSARRMAGAAAPAAGRSARVRAGPGRAPTARRMTAGPGWSRVDGGVASAGAAGLLGPAGRRAATAPGQQGSDQAIPRNPHPGRMPIGGKSCQYWRPGAIRPGPRAPDQLA